MLSGAGRRSGSWLTPAAGPVPACCWHSSGAGAASGRLCAERCSERGELAFGESNRGCAAMQCARWQGASAAAGDEAATKAAGAASMHSISLRLHLHLWQRIFGVLCTSLMMTWWGAKTHLSLASGWVAARQPGRATSKLIQQPVEATRLQRQPDRVGSSAQSRGVCSYMGII